jgi:hypothetical protein
VKQSASTANLVNLQLNLPLPDVPAATLPDDKQRELVRALVEMLVGAARGSASSPVSGGSNESETDQ